MTGLAGFADFFRGYANIIRHITKILEKYRRKAFSDGRQKTLCSRSRSANKQSAKRAAAAGFPDYGRTSTSSLHLQPTPPTSTYSYLTPCAG